MSKKKKKIIKYFKIIDKIQNTRKKNNANWMDICRVALKSSPDETIKLMKEINKCDDRISKLFKSIK